MKKKLIFIVCILAFINGCLNLDIIGYKMPLIEKPKQNSAKPIEESEK